MKCVSLALAAFLCSLAPGVLWPQAPAECLVAEAGESRAVIVARPELAARLGAALADLQEYAYRLSGARLEIRSQALEGWNSLHLVVEGSGPTPPDVGELAALNDEGFLVRLQDGSVWLAGRTELAVQHAIYWLLEQWGCRWLFPGAAGEVVPARDRLAVRADMQTGQQPAFLMRSLWYNYGYLLPRQIREERLQWLRRNRLQYSWQGSIGHSYRNIVPRDDDQLFAEHPEYYPLSNGRRVRNGQICTGDPGVRARAVEYAFNYFREHPAATLVSLSPNDGGGAWRCPENDSYASFSDAALDLANHVADALRANPTTRGKMVAMYAYFDTAFAPSIEARENVVVFIATRLSYLPWQWRLRSWAKKAGLLGIRAYASILPWHWTRPTWGLGRLQRSVRLWSAMGVRAVNIESGNDWGGWGLYHYVLARLLWDPQVEVEAVVRDFLRSGFQEAAPAMGRYFGRWKGGYSPSALRSAMLDVAEALDHAGTPELRWRIAQYALYLHHLRLYDRYRAAEGRSGRREALRALVGFDWRLAPTNMAHTIPLIDNYFKKEGKRQLSVREAEHESWKQTAPFSVEEARSLLERDLR